MYIKKGTIVSIRETNEEILKNKSSRDINIIKNTVNTFNVKYLICLRKVDDTHFLCAYISSNKSKRSIPIKFNSEELWVNYAHFVDVNSDFLQIKVVSNEYLSDMVSKIYANHNLFVEESKKKKKEEKIKRQEQKRQLAKEKKSKKKNFNNSRTKKCKIKKQAFRSTSTSTTYSSNWWNVNHPVSAGRGNF